MHLFIENAEIALRQLTLDHWYQTVLYYTLLVLSVLLIFKMIKHNGSRKTLAATDWPDDIMRLKSELRDLGEELELAYCENDRLSDILLQSLDHVPHQVIITDTGHWTIDVEARQSHLSPGFKLLFGIPPDQQINFIDSLELINSHHNIAEGDKAALSFKIFPKDNSRPKWLKLLTKSKFDKDGLLKTVTGRVILTRTEHD